MASRYLPVNASVYLDFAPSAYSLEAFFNPKTFHPRQSRVLFHETVHFWQYLNSGYLMRLVEEDWSRLTHFENTGEFLSAAPCRRHYMTPDETHGMSPRDLVEVFARFWDVQVIGPPELIAMDIEEGKTGEGIAERYREMERRGSLRHPAHGGYSWESFELAMEGPGGGWARPYAMLRQSLPMRAASVFFPIAASLALKTSDPIRAYVFLMSGTGDLENVLAPVDTPHKMWRWCDDFLSDVLGHLEDEILLGNGIKVAGEGPLGKTPYWAWMIGYVLTAAAELAVRDGRELTWEEAVPAGIGELSFLLACPGDPQTRSLLVPLLLPPLVTFADGSAWSPAAHAARAIEMPEEQLTYVAEASAMAAQIGERWETFLNSRH
ncbi:MAG: hypothetical protein QNJ06_04595 [Kiloniellales bacterium]|nr:hypothetical protein [Kiloniellales bacterium]MDJ0981705.1 hypothetical protein [Kiloniellales bacterium]